MGVKRKPAPYPSRASTNWAQAVPLLLAPAEAVFQVVSHGEDNDALGRLDADIGVQADHVAASRLLDNLLQ